MEMRVAIHVDERLHTVLEDYIVTIYRLQEAYGSAKTTYIARELNVAPATVTKVLANLSSKGFIRKQRYKGAVLTEAGLKLARKIVWKHRVLEVFLHKILEFDVFDVHDLAHSMEHIPDEIVERMYVKLSMPKACPHGNPISSEGGDEDLERLTSCSPGEACEIRRIVGEFKWVLNFLKRSEITLGSLVSVEAKDKENVYIRKGDELIPVPRDIAYVIAVKRVMLE